jgi:hypothetical protein
MISRFVDDGLAGQYSPVVIYGAGKDSFRFEEATRIDLFALKNCSN